MNSKATHISCRRGLPLAVLLIMLAVFFTACGPDPTIARSEREVAEAQQEAAQHANRTLRVGVKSKVKNFGYQDVMTGEFNGIEIDLAYLLAAELGYDSVELVATTAAGRMRVLQENTVDCVLATFTITEERKETLNFSAPYYADYTRIMAEKDSGINSLADLVGKRVGVVRQTTSAASIVERMIGEGLIPAEGYDEASFDPAAWTQGVSFVLYNDYPAAEEGLQNKEADAVSSDKSILSSFVDESRILLTERLSVQHYGVATLKDSPISEPINEAIEKWSADGTIDALCVKYGI